MSVVTHVMVLGATSLVGRLLLPRLISAGCSVVAFTRSVCMGSDDGVEWRSIPPHPNPLPQREGIRSLVCVAPIWVLPEHFALLETYGVRRIVMLSSTSRFTKDDSSDVEEQKIAQRLAESEAHLQAWAEAHGVEWFILRPTLIYGLGHDKNIAEIARFILRFGFFPLFGKTMGLRQPIHADDVAAACVTVLLGNGVNGTAVYKLSGGETIAYREMVARVFKAMGRRPRFVNIPLFAFRLAVAVLRFLPRYRHWSSAMAERMNQDLVFDHSDAVRDLSFKPRPFVLTAEDVLE